MSEVPAPAQNREALLDEARLRREESDNRLRYTIDYALAGLKGLFLANGGAILALLTFIGNSGAKVEVRAIFWAFTWFAIGMVGCLTTYFLAAISQSHSMNATFNEALQCRSDAFELGEKYDSDSWVAKSDRADLAASILAVFSLAMFILGSFVALDAIT